MSSSLDIGYSQGYFDATIPPRREVPPSPMSEYTVANNVRACRIEIGMTQQELAAAVGVSRQSINSIEQGKYIPSLPLALRLARVFTRATDEIFELQESES
jgi:putative transcriptional regulator